MHSNSVVGERWRDEEVFGGGVQEGYRNVCVEVQACTVSRVE